MNKLILDPNAYSFTAIAVLPKQDRGDNVKPNAAGEYPQKTSMDGTPQWTVQALVQTEAGKPETVEVTIASDVEPRLTPLSPVEFVNLTGSPWLNNGRAGVAFRADSVKPKTSKSMTNGTKPAAESAPAAV